jgi:dUTP pyrophosphatase
VTLSVKLLRPDVKPPVRKSEGAAGYDLYAPSSGRVAKGKLLVYPLGVALKLPPGTYGKMYGRSSLEVQGLHVLGCAVKEGTIAEGAELSQHSVLYGLAGVLDEDYTGELKVVFKSLGTTDIEWAHGDRICQIVISPYLAPSVEVVDELTVTVRGSGGFGSTGS